MTGLVRGQRTKLEQMTKRWQRREVSNFDCEIVPSYFLSTLLTSCDRFDVPQHLRWSNVQRFDELSRIPLGSRRLHQRNCRSCPLSSSRYFADPLLCQLDLTKSSTFRDLSKPMGAQSEPRRSEFRDRYTQLMELDDDTTKPFQCVPSLSAGRKFLIFDSRQLWNALLVRNDRCRLPRSTATLHRLVSRASGREF